MSDLVHKPKKKRSPSYPAYTLGDAIAKTGTIHDQEGEHFAPPDAIASHWETKTTSSSFMQWISTLRQFGLLEETGSGEGRRFKVSSDALDILTYEANSEKWRAAIQRVALLPPLHAELWKKYDGDLPSDQNMRAYLLRERPESTFNKASVDSFIARFRATLAFAGLIEADTMEAGGGEPESPKLGGLGQPLGLDTFDRFRKPPTMNAAPTGGQQVVAFGKTNMRELPITLPTLQVAVIKVPFPMTAAEFKTFSDSIASFRDALVQPPPEDQCDE